MFNFYPGGNERSWKSSEDYERSWSKATVMKLVGKTGNGGGVAVSTQVMGLIGCWEGRRGDSGSFVEWLLNTSSNAKYNAIDVDI